MAKLRHCNLSETRLLSLTIRAMPLRVVAQADKRLDTSLFLLHEAINQLYNHDMER